MCEDMRGTVEEPFQSKVLGEVPSRVVGHSGLIRRACSHKARDASTVATEPRSLNSAAQ